MAVRGLELDGTVPARAQNAGLFVSRGEGVHPDRVIDSHELIFVREGVLSVREEERPFEVEAGQSLILRPRRRHEGTEPYPPDLSFYWVHFVVDDGGEVDAGATVRVPKHTTVGRPDHLAELFRRFLDDQEAGRLRPVPADLLLMLMLCEVSESYGAEASAEDNAAVLAGRADAHIRTHFHAPLSTSGLARELGCNPDYLGRVFRRVYGKTPTEAIHWRRLRHARRMLLEGDRNVEEISRTCGFRDVRYFRRLFKRHEGMTPLAFRRLYAQMHVNTL
jgi:AraC-like DNA-binding protein